MHRVEQADYGQTNVTIGRQQVSEEGRLLGAGVSAGPTYDGLGLAANPKAMGHGIRQQAPAEASLGFAATGNQVTSPAKEPQQQLFQRGRTSESRSAPESSLQQRQEWQQERQQQEQKCQEAEPTDKDATPGQPHGVGPPSPQAPWYTNAWKWFKTIVLGTSPDLIKLGPPWIKWPDYDRLNNINALLLGLWPTLSNAIEQQIVAAMMPQMLADISKQYGAGYLTGLELLEFDLGKVPPRIDGLKVYDELGEEQLLMEVATSWGSNIKVTIGASVHLLGHHLRIPLTVSNVQFHALMRISARPLMTDFPYVGSVGLSLIEAPHVEFELPVSALGGLDVMALPLVRFAFHFGARLAARQFLVYPKGIQIPLVPGGGSLGPVGMLEVGLIRISGLRSEDLIGHSDPFVIIRLKEGREQRSRTKHNNNNPEYNETFRLLVEDVETQVLQLIVMDSDLVGLKDKVIGVAQMPLKESACLAMPKTHIPVTLNIQKLMSANFGIGGVLRLPVRAAGLPISAASAVGRSMFKNFTGLTGAIGLGGAAEHQHNSDRSERWNKVLDETGWLGPSEEYLEAEEADLSKPEIKNMASDATVTTESRKNNSQYGSNNASGSQQIGVASAELASPFGTAVDAAQQQASTSSSSNGARDAVAGSQAGLRNEELQINHLQQQRASVVTGRGAAGSSSTPSSPGGGGAAAGLGQQRGQQLRRLSSQSAPLGGYDDRGDPYTTDTAGSGSGQVARPGLSSANSAEQQMQIRRQQHQKDTEQTALEAQHDVEKTDVKKLDSEGAKPKYRGTIYLELTYMPFKILGGAPTGAGASPAANTAAISGARSVQPSELGILTATLIRAKGLTGWSGEADPYVTLSLVEAGGGTIDDTSSGSSAGALGKHRSTGIKQEMRSNTIFNEDNPRWNEKFDFIMVPAGSILLATVWDQTTPIEAITSLSLSRERFKDQVLGRVKVPVLDVAAAGRIRDSWPLQGALMGELEMALQWIPASLVE